MVKAKELLERERELAQISGALQPTGDGAAIVAIEGPPGIGKSCLLEAAAKIATTAGARPLVARGSEVERDYALGVVIQLLAPVLERADAGERRRLFAGAAAHAEPIFEHGSGAPPPGEDAFPLFHGLQWLIANAAERERLVLLIDDLQWADTPSVRFLLFLAQRVSDLDVALLVTLRPAEPGAPADLLEALLAHPLTRVVRPAPLTPPTVAMLVRERLPHADDGFCSACSEATNGNPFLVTELVSAIEAERIEPTAEHAREVERLAPDAVQRATLARIARLSREAGELAQAVAVLGGEAPLRRAAELAGIGLPSAPDLADALAAIEVLAPGEPLRFAHPLLRTVVYDDIPPARRAALHGQAARLLSTEAAESELVAAHLHESTPLGAAWVVDTLVASADAASARGGQAAAVHHLTRALAEPPPPERRGAILRALAQAKSAIGDTSAVADLEQAIAATADARTRAEMQLELGRTLFLFGLMERAADAFEQGMREVPAGETELAAQLEASWITIARTQIALRPAAVERLQPLLERPPEGDGPAERALLAQVANQLVFAAEGRERAVELARRAWADGALLREEGADGTSWIGAIAAVGWAGELELFEAWCNELLEDARRRGSLMAFANVSYGRSYGRYYMGWLSEAVADAEAAVEARHLGWEQFVTAACAQLAWCHIDRGDLDLAEAALAIVAETKAPTQDTLAQVLVDEAEARIELARGRSEHALELAERSGAGARDALIPNPAIVPWRATGALAAAAIGERERARELSDEDLLLSRRFGAPRPLGVALRVAGLIAPEPSAGIGLLRESVEVLEGAPARLEYARALLDLGATLRRGGHRREAREPLGQALELAQQMGARALETRAFDELLASGARPRRGATSGVASLTPTELRVARMAAEGMTNREIAQALFVTVKGVQWHLGNTYRKLGTQRAGLREALDRG